MSLWVIFKNHLPFSDYFGTLTVNFGDFDSPCIISEKLYTQRLNVNYFTQVLNFFAASVAKSSTHDMYNNPKSSMDKTKVKHSSDAGSISLLRNN